MTTTSLPTTFLFIESYLYGELHSSLPSIWITVIEILNEGGCVCVCVCVCEFPGSSHCNPFPDKDVTFPLHTEKNP